MIVPMLKVLVVGPKPLMADVIETVQRMGRVHLAKAQGERGGIAAGQLTAAEADLKQLLEHVCTDSDGLLSLLAFRGTAAPAAAVTDWSAVLDGLRQRTESVRALVKQLLEIEDELAIIKSYHLAFEALGPLLARLEQSGKIKAFGFIIRGADTSVVEPIRLELKKQTNGRCEIYSRQLGDGRVATLVAYHVNDADKIRAFFAKAGINELKLPATVAELPMAEAVKLLKQKLHDLPGRVRELQAQLDGLARQTGPELAGVKSQALDILNRLNVRAQVDESRFGFILQGYLPQHDLPRLKDMLAVKYQDKVTVQVLEIGHQEAPQVPVILKNNPVVRPFELMLSIFRPPQYGTVDPTPFIAVFFPMFFGFIIGDIGYGAAMFVIALLMWSRFKSNSILRSIATIFIIGSLWSIGFGVLFGELFGDLGEHLHLVRPVMEKFNRLGPESRDFLRNIAWYTGGFQIAVGYAILFYQGWRHRNWHHMLEAPAFMIGILGFLGLFFTLFLPLLPKHLLLPSIIMSLIAIVSLGKIAGIGAIFEIFGAIGNILSYARLFAIGLSAAYLGYAANMIARLMGGSPLMTVLGIVVGVVFHILFFGLGLISPIMQPFRLQVVEFFTKFKYHDYPGKQYKPFKTTGGN